MKFFLIFATIILINFGLLWFFCSDTGNSWRRRIFLGQPIVKFKTYGGSWERRNVMWASDGRLFVWEYPSIQMDRRFVDDHADRIQWITKKPQIRERVSVR